MISGLFTPCRAVKENDVKTRLILLTEMVKAEYQIGFEIVGPVSDFTDPNNHPIIAENIAWAKKNGLNQVVIHSPVERRDWTLKHTNLSNPESIGLLQTVFDLANEIGTKIVVAHAEVLHTYKEMDELTDARRKNLLDAIIENVSKVNKGQALLAIENMPYPLAGDLFYCRQDMVFDPLFTDLLELHEFVLRTKNFITFDTCHAGTLLYDSLENKFHSVEDKVVHLHLSDITGIWNDGTSVFHEGLIPGEGSLKKEIVPFLAHLKNSEKSFSITLEVADKDFKDPQESRESFKRVLAWLEES